VPLDPQVKKLLDVMPPMPDFGDIDVAALRSGMAEGVFAGAEPEPVAHVEERTLPGPAGDLRVRVYTPDGPEGEGPFPGLVFFHGGGFVLCDLDTHDGQCRSLANAAGCVVVSVDYRLAPEHPFPAAPEDCYAATCHVGRHAADFGIDPARLAVAGDSAGGNLAAVVCQMVRDRGGPPLCFQLLVYPVTNFDLDTDSYRENAEGYFLSRGMMAWFWDQYLPDREDGASPLASPLRAPDLRDLPPGLCVTAEYDPLRDEGEAYAERLRAAGVDVRTRRYDGMIHGFFGMGALVDRAREAVADAGAALRKAFA